MSNAGFNSHFLSVCRKGYSVLGRTPARVPDHIHELHFESCSLPSYSARMRHRFLKTLETAKNIPHGSVLEVAAGGGFNGVCLQEPGKRVVLNDMRFLESEIGIWPNSKDIEIRPGDLFELSPDKLGKFDLVLACEVLEHVAHGDRFIAHLKKFLNPGGSLLITTPNGEYFRSKLPTHSQVKDFTKLEAEQFKPDSDGHLYLYTQSEIENLLKACGFESVEVKLSQTPWLTGDMLFRKLPKSRWLDPVYFGLDQLFSSLGNGARRKLCTQMTVIAR